MYHLVRLLGCAALLFAPVGLHAGEAEVQADIVAADEAVARWDYKEAIQCYSRAFEKDPFNAYAFAGRGFMYSRIGDLERAISDTTRAVQLDPKNSRAYVARGIAYAHRDELDKAIADLSAAVSLVPDDWRAVSQRGDFYVRKGESDKAIADYDRAVELDPTVAVNFCCRGDLHAALGDYDAAAADYLRAQKLDPQYPAPYISYGWMLATCHEENVRNPTKAIEYAKIGLDLNPDREDAWPAYAAALAAAGKFDEAAEWQQKFADAKVLSEQARVEAQSRVALYKSHQPLVQPKPTLTPKQAAAATPAAAEIDE
jgi:tetratricopeptide (TPR) repeat protein